MIGRGDLEISIRRFIETAVMPMVRSGIIGGRYGRHFTVHVDITPPSGTGFGLTVEIGGGAREQSLGAFTADHSDEWDAHAVDVMVDGFEPIEGVLVAQMVAGFVVMQHQKAANSVGQEAERFLRHITTTPGDTDGGLTADGLDQYRSVFRRDRFDNR